MAVREVFVLTAGVVVGLAFVIAGASKFAAGDGWPEQARGLGAPSWTIGFLPWIELVVGAALIAQLAHRVSAAAAIVLLMSFSALIVRRMSEGVRPPCACFGAWSSAPIGPRHLLRNAALIAGALVIVVWG